MDSHLIIRKLFGDHDDNSTHVCPSPDTSGPAIVPLVGNMSFHTFAMILSGACGIFSILIILFVVMQHAFNYSNPIQQRQIIRVVCLVPYAAIFSFLIVWLEGAGPYLVESLDFGCSLALAAFLLLLCDYILSHPDGFNELFGAGATKHGQYTGGSPPWLKRTWYATLQFIPTSIIIWVATAASLAAGTYCATSDDVHFAHIWIQVFKVIVTAIALLAVIRFEKKMISKLRPHNVFLKLFAFKGIIGINFIQTFIVNILSSKGAIKPTSHLTEQDLVTTIPALLLACELPIFAILLLTAFPASPYKNGGKSAGPFNAIFDAINYTDIVSAFFRGPMRLVRGQQYKTVGHDSDGSVQPPPQYNGANYTSNMRGQTYV